MDSQHCRDWTSDYARRVRRRAELAAGFESDTEGSSSESSEEDVIAVHGSNEGSEEVSPSATAAPPAKNFRIMPGKSDGEIRGLRYPNRVTTAMVNFENAGIKTGSILSGRQAAEGTAEKGDGASISTLARHKEGDSVRQSPEDVGGGRMTFLSSTILQAPSSSGTREYWDPVLMPTTRQQESQRPQKMPTGRTEAVSDTVTHVTNSAVAANTRPHASLSDLKPAAPVRDLTTEENMVVNKRKNYTVGDQVVRHGQAQSFLSVNAWAGDVIINSFSFRINQKNRNSVASDPSYPSMYVFNSFLADHLLPMKESHLVTRSTTHEEVKNWFRRKNGLTVFIGDMDVLMFPLNEKQCQWTLLFLDARTRSLMFYDPLGNALKPRERERCKRLRQYVLEEDKNRRRQGPGPVVSTYDGIEEWPLNECKTFPKQMDGDSCGLFIMWAAYYVERGYRPTFGMQDRQVLRKRTVAVIRDMDIGLEK